VALILGLNYFHLKNKKQKWLVQVAVYTNEILSLKKLKTRLAGAYPRSLSGFLTHLSFFWSSCINNISTDSYWGPTNHVLKLLHQFPHLKKKYICSLFELWWHLLHWLPVSKVLCMCCMGSFSSLTWSLVNFSRNGMPFFVSIFLLTTKLLLKKNGLLIYFLLIANYTEIFYGNLNFVIVFTFSGCC
jgi:hypothetical protein